MDQGQDHGRTEPAPDAELLLVVHVAGRRFALRASDVAEVHRMVRVSPLPEAPDAVTGVIDIRGMVVPVLDLRSRLGVAARQAHPDDRLVVVMAAERRLALHVEHTVEALSARIEDLEHHLSAGVSYAAGLVRRPDGVVFVHDIEAFLAADELSALDDALATRVTA